ncbi:MAG: hypothetical protein H0X45_00920 [Planctomycetes bacterium]|nr:hypothetical protein [Planctomycetota bacterium]
MLLVARVNALVTVVAQPFASKIPLVRVSVPPTARSRPSETVRPSWLPA